MLHSVHEPSFAGEFAHQVPRPHLPDVPVCQSCRLAVPRLESHVEFFSKSSMSQVLAGGHQCPA